MREHKERGAIKSHKEFVLSEHELNGMQAEIERLEALLKRALPLVAIAKWKVPDAYFGKANKVEIDIKQALND